MGNKGGGRKGFVKSAAATKLAEAPPISDEAVGPTGQAYHEPSSDGKKTASAPEASVLSLPESQPPEGETRGQMLQRHKKEAKQLKEAAKKAGKKHKDEADRLETALDERQQTELAQRSMAEFGVAAEQPEEAVDADQEEEASKEEASKGATRAKKRRDKAAARASEREQRIAAESAAMGESDKAAEQRQLSQLLAPLGLCIRDIAADGHCLYRSINDQLHQTSSSHEAAAQPAASGVSPVANGGAAPSGGPHGYQELRATAASYMRQHAPDFEPFLEQDSDDEAPPHERFATYCNDVESTAAWGGDMELNALSRALQRHFVVHCAGLPPVEFGTAYADKGPTLHLCYLRHAFGLGEHYNSVQRLQENGHSEGASEAELAES